MAAATDFVAIITICDHRRTYEERMRTSRHQIRYARRGTKADSSANAGAQDQWTHFEITSK